MRNMDLLDCIAGFPLTPEEKSAIILEDSTFKFLQPFPKKWKESSFFFHVIPPTYEMFLHCIGLLISWGCNGVAWWDGDDAGCVDAVEERMMKKLLVRCRFGNLASTASIRLMFR